MFTVVVATGLANANLSGQHRFVVSESTAGQAEIDRLTGKGRTLGAGPLPTFLSETVRAGSAGAPIGLLVLEPEGDDDASEPADCFAPSLASAATLTVRDGVLPWPALLDRVREMSGVDPLAESARQGSLRFLVVGTHTEKDVAAVATLLRCALGCPDVAVSPHLTGSATQEAHYAVLRHNLRQAGIRVLLDLEDVADFVGIPAEPLAELGCHPCRIEPDDAREAMDPAQRRIVELLCMHWTRVHLRPLAGGYSGSLLFLADGWKGPARTEPMVLKIDNYPQMRREIGGYHRVKDFFGKHVPTFGYPVARDGHLGVAMELAAMEGRPRTLQDEFEEAESEQALAHFLVQLEKALGLLSDKLYRNTSTRTTVVPYRAFGLQIARQLVWLKGNTEAIQGYLEEAGRGELGVDIDALQRLVAVIVSNPDGIESESCLSHGDLNFANAICDAGGNIWFIDWTHTDISPIELDFAKLENDVKFVMSKAFDLDDLPRLHAFEEFLLASRVPAGPDELPDHLKFVKWDLRFRKILASVRAIRHFCFALKASDDWLAYRIALLRYAVHNLSFDKRRGRGECELPALTHALYSVETLAMDLVGDDFHLKIRSERPASYPARQRISIDESPWLLDCDSYDPPYHVEPAVLANDRTKVENGWADPEEFALVPTEPGRPEPKHKDAQGRGLNPRGRTGIAGRGALGRWGRNLAVAGVLARAQGGTCEILVCRRPDANEFELPEGFVLPDEESRDAVTRIVEKDTGWRPPAATEDAVFEGYTYDPRQTDHAWVEGRAYLVVSGDDSAPDTFSPSENYEEIAWRPFDSETVNRLLAHQARFAREAAKGMVAAGILSGDLADRVLARTG